MEMLIQAIAVYRKKNGDGQDSIYRRACEQCVNAGGLKYIFPVLIGKALPRAAVCNDAHHKIYRRACEQCELCMRCASS